MDNIKDENLKRLGRYIAQALIDQALMTAVSYTHLTLPTTPYV